MGVNFIELYENHYDFFKDYISNKNTEGTVKKTLASWEKFKLYFNIELEKPGDFFLIFQKNKKKLDNEENTIKNFRRFLNFLKEKDLLDEDILIKFLTKINYKQEIRIRENNYTDDELEISFNNMKEYNVYYYKLYLMLYLSGMRVDPFFRLIQTFDSRKIKYFDNYDVVIYKDSNISYEKKGSDKLFLPLGEIDFLRKNIKEFKKLNKSTIQNHIKRNKKIIPLVFLRKFNATHLLRDRIATYTTTMYIQARSLHKDILISNYDKEPEKRAIEDYSNFLKRYYYLSELYNLEKWEILDYEQKERLYYEIFSLIIDLYYLNDDFINKYSLSDKFKLFINKEKIGDFDFEQERIYKKYIETIPYVKDFLLKNEYYKDIKKYNTPLKKLREELENKLNRFKIELNDILVWNKEKFRKFQGGLNVENQIQNYEIILGFSENSFEDENDYLSELESQFNDLTEEEFRINFEYSMTIFDESFYNKNKDYISNFKKDIEKYSKLENEIKFFDLIEYYKNIDKTQFISVLLHKFEIYLNKRDLIEFKNSYFSLK